MSGEFTKGTRVRSTESGSTGYVRRAPAENMLAQCVVYFDSGRLKGETISIQTAVLEVIELAGLTPTEIDGQLFPILDDIARIEQGIAEYRYLLGEVGRMDTTTRKLRYNDPGTQRTEWEKAKAQREAELAALETKAAPFEAQWEERRWTRYLIVPGGHLHYRSCHTLTPGRTMVGQVAEASGLSADEVVEKYDATACTHCFPDAPVPERKTPAEEGLCDHSGEYVADKLVKAGKLTPNWYSRYISPTVPCECGWRGAITKGGKLRKHKSGGNQ